MNNIRNRDSNLNSKQTVMENGVYLSHPNVFPGEEKANYEKIYDNTMLSSSGKGSDLLKLTKSQLALYNEGKCTIRNKIEKSENEVDSMLSTLETEFSSPLKNSALSIEHSKENSTLNKSDVEDFNNFLASLSSITEIPESGHREDCEQQKESSFDKISGLHEVKNILRNVFVYPISYPQFFPGNIHWTQVLLYGPPGTGKSLLAEAIANEINASLYKISSADILSHWHGETEKQIRALFENVRSAETPVILFFDEIDGLCRRRSSSEDDLVRRIKTELLLQFEEATSEGQRNRRTYLLGATNCPWDIDSAFLRRFHRKIYVPLPDREARIDILKKGFRDVPTELTNEEWEFTGDLTEGYSGSDLINIVMGSCCERLVHMMNCKYWKINGTLWFPAAPDSLFSTRMNFEDIPVHRVYCRPIKLIDLKAAISKSPKSVSDEELLKFEQYS